MAIATALFAAGLAFAYWIVLPRALHFLTTYNEEFFEIEIRANYYFSFVTLGPDRLRARLPAAHLRPGARPPRRPHLRNPAAQPPHRLRQRPRRRDPAPHGRPGLARVRGRAAPPPLRAVHLGLRHPREALGRADRGPPRGLRRRHRHVGEDTDRLRGRLGRPGRGSARARRRRRRGRGRPHRRGRAGGRARRRAADVRGRGHRPGVRERPLPPRVRGLRGLRRRLRVPALDRPARDPEAAPPRGRRGRHRQAGRGRVPPLGDRDDRRRELHRAPPRRLRRARPRRHRLPGGLRRRPRGRARPLRGARDTAAGALSERLRLGVSPHAPYTTSADVYEACAGLGSRSPPTWPRARPSRNGCCTAPGR